eukprot:755135-Hanusia_phi.AAC.3
MSTVLHMLGDHDKLNRFNSELSRFHSANLALPEILDGRWEGSGYGRSEGRKWKRRPATLCSWRENFGDPWDS